MNNNENNGLVTKIWGPSAWDFFHSIAFGYPVVPTEEDKKHYYELYNNFQYTLPCVHCRRSYELFIKEGNAKLSSKVFETRDSLTLWTYLLHEEVNRKLQVNYGLSYQEFVDKYEARRAKCTKTDKGCFKPLQNNPYEISTKKTCPVIPIKLAKKFKYYAKEREIDTLFIKDKMDDIKDITTDEWDKRNKECAEIIFYMRSHNIPAIETGGRWIGLPTKQELELITRLCSTLSTEYLNEIIIKLPSKKKINKIYKLKK